jgi:hypothetical protein
VAVTPQQPTPQQVVVQQAARPARTRVRDVIAGIVACMGLLALVAIVAIAILSLPGTDKGTNIVAIATAALGVIGPIIGAYFGIRSAANAVQTVQGGPGGP